MCLVVCMYLGISVGLHSFEFDLGMYWSYVNDLENKWTICRAMINLKRLQRNNKYILIFKVYYFQKIKIKIRHVSIWVSMLKSASRRHDKWSYCLLNWKKWNVKKRNIMVVSADKESKPHFLTFLFDIL